MHFGNIGGGTFLSPSSHVDSERLVEAGVRFSARHIVMEAKGKFHAQDHGLMTREFKEKIQARIESDPVFREELFKEGIDRLLSGDVETGKAVLRDYINATIGFQALGGLTEKSPKSLMRMFGPKGNPQARNLFRIIGFLQKQEGFRLKVDGIR